ncbi:MAG: hypothetical protein IPJ88_16320 [Myxococcales bacterium]|nr:MAG: hypothetical protein IPJ88_16320 [Myxococcales bacterium]
MNRQRLYWIFLPAIVGAACILGYYTILTASQFEKLGERSIAQSVLLLVQEKVDRIEKQIIDADNTVFDVVSLEHLDTLTQDFVPLAEQSAPSVRSIILDDTLSQVAFVTRAGKKSIAPSFWKSSTTLCCQRFRTI